jgi:hypothetical protein
MVRQEPQVVLVVQEYQVHKVQQVLKELQGPEELKERLVHKVLKVLPDLLEDPQVHKVLKGPQDRLPQDKSY